MVPKKITIHRPSYNVIYILFTKTKQTGRG